MITDTSHEHEDVSGRVCFVVRGLNGGGAQRDAILLANELQRTGIESAIVTLQSHGPLRDLIASNVPLIDLGRGKKLRLAFAAGSLHRLIVAGRPRAIVSSEAAGNVLAIAATRFLPDERRPLIILREVASPVEARHNDPYWQNRLAYRFARFAYPLADYVLTFTAGAKRDLEQRFGVPPARVVNFGTNAVLTPVMRQRIASLSASSEPGLVVSVGRLSPEKDHRTLIEAFAILRRTHAARLVIIGDGSERASLEDAIEASGVRSDATLIGHLADPLPTLARAWLYVCSSLHEGLGNALIEALACGVPVVSTDAPHGPREILRDGQLGTLVPLRSPDALAHAMADALDNPRDPAELRTRANDFTVESAAARFAEILDLGSPGSHHESVQQTNARHQLTAADAT